MNGQQTIVLRGPGPDGGTHELPAIHLKDGLGVTRAWGATGFALTHVRSGTRVALFTHRPDAISCARALAPLARWHDERPTEGLAEVQRAKITAAIATFEGTRP